MTEVQSKQEFYDAVAKGRTGIHPEHWPAGVETISMQGLGLLGLDAKGNLYLDGHKVYTERRLATQERVIAWVVAVSAAVTATATAYTAMI